MPAFLYRPPARFGGRLELGADGAGEIGFFSPGSYWPLGVAAASLTAHLESPAGHRRVYYGCLITEARVSADLLHLPHSVRDLLIACASQCYASCQPDRFRRANP